MSDLSIYEHEDTIWDAFDQVDDHIVPHPTTARICGNLFDGDSYKKLRREATPVLSNAGTPNSSFQEKEVRDSKPSDKKKKMMEKESPSHALPDVFNASFDGDMVKGVPDLASDDARMSNNCFKSSYATSGSEFCMDDRVLNGISAADDSNSYSYPLTHISQPEDLCFVNHDGEDKESSDLLYYGWPDIGNFEDVDKMLRSCDSSFGLGVTDNDDEIGWFASHQIGGTEEALDMDFKFLCSEPSALKIISQDSDSPKSNNHRSSCISESKDGLNFKDQSNLHKKPSKHQNRTEGTKAGQCLGNDGPFYHISDLKSSDSQLSSLDKSDRVSASVGQRQQYRNLELDCFGHMQTNTSCLHPEYGQAPSQTTAGPLLSGIKSEHKGLKSPSHKGLKPPSPKESSHASNQGHSMESSGDLSFQGAAAKVVERKQVHHKQGFQPLFIGNPRQTGMMFQASESDLICAQKQAHLSANELESQSDAGLQKGVTADIGSLNVPESSSVSSELDEISLEATSFRQLQQVMEQLDVRTKLCIRDSLYRLARSAEQRHNNPSLGSSTAVIDDIGGPLMTERTNKCTGFMGMETDTNPIDRSIAHLLFHRPSESPNLPSPLPLKPNAMNHGSITGPSMMAEKLVCQDEAAAAASNDKIATD